MHSRSYKPEVEIWLRKRVKSTLRFGIRHEEVQDECRVSALLESPELAALVRTLASGWLWPIAGIDDQIGSTRFLPTPVYRWNVLKVRLRPNAVACRGKYQ